MFDALHSIARDIAVRNSAMRADVLSAADVTSEANNQRAFVEYVDRILIIVRGAIRVYLLYEGITPILRNRNYRSLFN